MSDQLPGSEPQPPTGQQVPPGYQRPPVNPGAPPAGQPYGAPIGAFNQPSGYQQPSYSAPPPTTQTNANAVAAFVLSLVAWAVCPIIPAIIALVLVSKARTEIAQSGGWQTGGGFATAAKIISWINLAFWPAIIIIYFGFILIVIGLGAASGGFSTPTPTPTGYWG